LGPLVGFKPIASSVFFGFSGLILFLNWVVLFLLKVGRFSGRRQIIFVWVQLWFDIVLVSLFVRYYSDDFSAAPVFYVFIILMSTLFFSRINVYLVAILSFVSYYTVSLVAHNVQLFSFDRTLIDPGIFNVAGGYFIVFFTVAMLGNFLKRVFDDNYEIILNQRKKISRLEFLRRRIVENLPSGLLSVNDSGIISYANPAAAELLELSSIEPGTDFNVFFPIDIAASQSAGITRMQCTLQIGERSKTFGLAFSDVEWEEGDQGKLILFQDLTRIKQLEDQQLVSEKMAAIGKMAAGVAHEIRNPLAALSGSVQVIGSMVPENPTLEELVDIVQMETKRLNHIINQFLSYARPLKTDQFKPVSPNELVKKFMKFALVDPLVIDYAVKYVPCEADVKIFGDQDQIIQILWNLIRNSCQASSPGGLILLKAETLSSELEISVCDHGEGMTKEEQQNLFTPFQRFRNGPGLGLGMSIVYEIVQLHRGRLMVNSRKGEGTTISVILPIWNEDGEHS
jgi:two-component system sensor histidine kinase PilS (NtrC family)